jgi:Delta3-Delta2-enoyl-CoA isomerase
LEQFNRPKSLNAFGGKLMQETISAIRELNEHPHTVFTVLTGEGRFFSAGADVRGSSLQPLIWTCKWKEGGELITCLASGLDTPENYASKAEKKIAYLTRFAPGMYRPYLVPIILI